MFASMAGDRRYDVFKELALISCSHAVVEAGSRRLKVLFNYV